MLCFVGHVTKLPETISKGILQVLCDNKGYSLSKQTIVHVFILTRLHMVVGSKHIQGSELLTENTIGFSPSCLYFNKLTKRHDGPPHAHTHTPIHTSHGNASESANGGDDESSRPAENLHGETC